MKTYKIIETNINHFLNIEIPFDFSNKKVGDNILFLGYDLLINQIGLIIVLSNKDYIISLLDSSAQLDIQK